MVCGVWTDSDGLPIDTAFLSSAKLDLMFSDLKKLYKPKPDEGFYWLIINNRIFICTAIFIILSTGVMRFITISFTSVALLVCGLGYLWFVYAKLPDYLILSSLFFITVSALLFERKQKMVLNRKYLKAIEAILMLLFFIWATIRLYKDNQINTIENEGFKKVYSEVTADKSKLVIITADAFPLQKFYLWDVPRDYMLTNVMMSEHFLHNQHQHLLKQYGLLNIIEIPFSDTVLFWGNRVNALEKYFFLMSNKPIYFQSLNQYKSGKGFRLVVSE